LLNTGFLNWKSSQIRVNARKSLIFVTGVLVFGRHTMASLYIILYLILKTAYPTLEFVFGVCPKPFDHPGIVVAVREIMVQSREAMLLAG
jgi:hypothetical protein